MRFKRVIWLLTLCVSTSKKRVAIASTFREKLVGIESGREKTEEIFDFLLEI